MKFLGKKKWFTLIEMLIVIVIIWVLASALIPRLGSARGKANDVARKADLWQLATAIITRQLDTNQTFEKFCPSTTVGCDIEYMSWHLIAWWMSSIPKDNSNAWKSFSWINVWSYSTWLWYMFSPIKKNAVEGWWFVLMSKVETEWWANYAACSSNPIISWWMDYSVVQTRLCNWIWTIWTCWSTACTYSDKEELRYVYLY